MNTPHVHTGTHARMHTQAHTYTVYTHIHACVYAYAYITCTQTHIQSGAESPPEMSQPLAEQREKERHFLEQLLDTSKLESYTVPVPIMADLRKYQQVSSAMVPLPDCKGFISIL